MDILVDPTTIMAAGPDAARILAARMIPDDQMPDDPSKLNIKVRGW